VIPISAVTGKGIPTLVHRVGELLDKLPPAVEPPQVIRTRPKTVEPEPVEEAVASDA
jgi:hypothetical protein